MTSGFSEDDARKAHAWFAVDRVSRQPETSAWKRRARLGQARWREAHGHPIGFEPYAGGARAKPIGSRLDLAFARASGANFISAGALAAVRARLAAPERFQMLKEDRLFADLLSSMPLCFNLFGDLAADSIAAVRALRAWWPDVPPGEVTVRFEHSPGRRDVAFLGNQSAFDVAFEVDLGDGHNAILGIETKYHEHAIAEPPPKPAALSRYVEVTERAGIFGPQWREQIIGTDLQQIWLDHLLVLAMLQHPSKRWTRGRFVLVFPEANPSFVSAAERYRRVLRDEETFGVQTLEAMVTGEALGASTREAIRERYLEPCGVELRSR